MLLKCNYDEDLSHERNVANFHWQLARVGVCTKPTFAPKTNATAWGQSSAPCVFCAATSPLGSITINWYVRSSGRLRPDGDIMEVRQALAVLRKVFPPLEDKAIEELEKKRAKKRQVA